MQALVTVIETVVLSVSAETLWPHLVETERLRAWREGVEQFGQGDLPAMGEAFPLVQHVAGKRLKGQAVLVQCEPGRALSYEVGRPGSGYMAARYDLWPQDDGCKLVLQQTVDAPRVPVIRGWLGRLLVAPKLRAEMQRDLGRLRQRLVADS